MKIIKISKSGNYLNHGIAYTEHGGYQGTSDNKWPIKMGIEFEKRNIMPGEIYQLEINGKNDGTIYQLVK